MVQAILQPLFDEGEIYFGKYGGQYCYGCERFYTEKEIVDGKCPDHQTPLTYIEEENYFFRMSAYQDWLRRYLEDHPERRPARALPQRAPGLPARAAPGPVDQPAEEPAPVGHPAAVRRPVRDLRLVRRAPQLRLRARRARSDQRFRRYWPHVQHLIGKDILKPHGIYWPCMLKAAGLLRTRRRRPRSPGFARLRVHGYWTLGGGKISKSVGNVVEALALTRKYGNDAFRYFVLREMPFGQDANFSEEALVERLNADLANDLGNLVSRATTMLVNFGAQTAGAPPAPEAADDAIRDARRRDRPRGRGGDGRVRLPARRWWRSGASSAR